VQASWQKTGQEDNEDAERLAMRAEARRQRLSRKVSHGA